MIQGNHAPEGRGKGCRFLGAAGLAAFLLAFSSPPAAAADTPAAVVRLANGEWPPYTGQHLPGHGCDSQVVTEAFALEGIQVTYEFLPWARGLLLSQNGVVDGAVEWAGTPEQRKTHHVSSEALSRQQWVFFQRKDAPIPWERLDDIRDRTIGVTIGYAYSDVFAELKKQRPAMFREASSDVLNLRKLLGGRIDLFPLERVVGRYLIARELTPEEQEALTTDGRTLTELTPHLLLSHAIAANEQRMTRFDRGLLKLRANGRYQELMAPCSGDGP